MAPCKIRIITLKIVFILPFSCSSSASTYDNDPMDVRSRINGKHTSKEVFENIIGEMGEELADNNLVLRPIKLINMMLATIVTSHKT